MPSASRRRDSSSPTITAAAPAASAHQPVLAYPVDSSPISAGSYAMSDRSMRSASPTTLEQSTRIHDSASTKHSGEHSRRESGGVGSHARTWSRRLSASAEAIASIVLPLENRQASSRNDAMAVPTSRGQHYPVAVDMASAPISPQFFTQSMMLNTIFILIWYVLATFLSMYNKYMFSESHLGFRFPLLVTAVHQLVQLVLAGILLWRVPRLRPAKWMKGREYGIRVVPCGIATGMDIGLSNSSLKTITLSFYTMVKSSSLIFVLLFAFIFHLERPRWSLVAVIMVISAGVLLMVANETNFELIGFIEVFLASIMGGLRWSLTQLLLSPKPRASKAGDGGYTTIEHGEPHDPAASAAKSRPSQHQRQHQHPVTSILHLAPVMAIAVFLAFFVLEFTHLRKTSWFDTPASALNIITWMLVGGLVAFAMVAAEFEVIRRVGVVTLSVAGIFKEVITILVSCWYFGDVLHAWNVAGLCVTLAGIAAYNWLKMREAGKVSAGALEQQTGGPEADAQYAVVDDDVRSSDEEDDIVESDRE